MARPEPEALEASRRTLRVPPLLRLPLPPLARVLVVVAECTVGAGQGGPAQHGFESLVDGRLGKSISSCHDLSPGEGIARVYVGSAGMKPRLTALEESFTQLAGPGFRLPC